MNILCRHFAGDRGLLLGRDVPVENFMNLHFGRNLRQKMRAKDHRNITHFMSNITHYEQYYSLCNHRVNACNITHYEQYYSL
jgi:hypothetical protein